MLKINANYNIYNVMTKDTLSAVKAQNPQCTVQVRPPFFRCSTRNPLVNSHPTEIVPKVQHAAVGGGGSLEA